MLDSTRLELDNLLLNTALLKLRSFCLNSFYVPKGKALKLFHMTVSPIFLTSHISELLITFGCRMQLGIFDI